MVIEPDVQRETAEHEASTRERSITDVYPEQPPGLDRPALTPVVRKVLGSAALEVTAWRCLRLTPAGAFQNPTNGGAYRVSGHAMADGQTRPWSLVLKELSSPAGMRMPNGYVISRAEAEDPARFNYWRREAHLYTSGRLDQLGGGLFAPRCFGAVEQPGDRIWLWLEDLGDSSRRHWQTSEYALAGEHLGRFNGRAPATGAYLADPWISRGWLRSWLETVIAQYVQLVDDAELWSAPSLRQVFPRPVHGRLLRLWEDRETLLDALDRLPRAFCHLDATRGNLVVRALGDAPATAALDWAFAGVAALGEELGALVIGTGLIDLLDVATIRHNEQHAVRGYLAGLRAAGWRGAADAVRTAYMASAALRYTFLAAELPFLALLVPDYPARAERHWGRPWAALLASRAELTYLLLDYADQVRNELARA